MLRVRVGRGQSGGDRIRLDRIEGVASVVAQGDRGGVHKA